jgi:Leucine Rich repeat
MSSSQFTFHHLLNYRSREQLQQMDDGARRALLMELLGRGQSEAVWVAVCELFAAWPEGQEKADALSAAEQALDSWDDRLRHVISSWGYLYEGGGLASLARLVRSVEISRREERGSGELYAIANSEHARNLKYLTIDRSELSGTSVRSLSDSPHLANLRHLKIRKTLLDDEDSEYLLQSRGLTGLRTLKLIEVGLKAAPLRAAAKSVPFTELREIDFSDNFIKSEGLSILSQAPWLASVEKLELRHNHIGDEGAAALAQSPHARALTLLDVSDNWLTEAGKNVLRGMADQKGFRLVV